MNQVHVIIFLKEVIFFPEILKFYKKKKKMPLKQTIQTNLLRRAAVILHSSSRRIIRVLVLYRLVIILLARATQYIYTDNTAIRQTHTRGARGRGRKSVGEGGSRVKRSEGRERPLICIISTTYTERTIYE